MKIENEKIKEVLLKSGFVSAPDLAKAAKAAQDLKKPLIDILLFRGIINDSLFGQLMAEEFKIPYINLGHKQIPIEVLNLIPEKMATAKKIIPFAKKDNTLSVAMEDPRDLETIELIKRNTGLTIKPHFTTAYSLSQALSQYKKDIKDKFEDIIQENIKKSTKGISKSDLSKAADEVPIVKILNTILEYAIAERASDVHAEQIETQFIIRMRIDGILHDVIQLPKTVAKALIARIKILANLKIDEHRVPQDGRFKYTVGDDRISLRVSIVPAFYGENVVLRLLFESARPLSLEELGITGKNMETIKEAMKKPHGMFLVTGPTGSGKTTTLYSVLNMLNSTEVKICTIEDPIEYDVNRLTQIQTNTTTGLTFARGLRSLLRHDPDIIMVGEIRDKETAQIAIHSALTGHLVLSTLHTNDASSTIPRLIDMGVEPFLISATLNIIIAQRLVRRICGNCISEIKPDSKQLAHLKKIFAKDLTKQKYYAGKGCDECSGSGYKGRVGIYEVMHIDDDIRQLVVDKKPPSDIRKIAEKKGMVAMMEDGLNKISSGLTTIEEILRVVEEE